MIKKTQKSHIKSTNIFRNRDDAKCRKNKDPTNVELSTLYVNTFVNINPLEQHVNSLKDAVIL